MAGKVSIISTMHNHGRTRRVESDSHTSIEVETRSDTRAVTIQHDADGKVHVLVQSLVEGRWIAGQAIDLDALLRPPRPLSLHSPADTYLGS